MRFSNFTTEVLKRTEILRHHIRISTYKQRGGRTEENWKSAEKRLSDTSIDCSRPVLKESRNRGDKSRKVKTTKKIKVNYFYKQFICRYTNLFINTERPCVGVSSN